MTTQSAERFTPIKERWKYVKSKNQSVAPQVIIAAVANYFGEDASEIMGPSQRQELCLCRHIISKIIYRNVKITQEQLGEMFDRDRTSVIHGIRVLTGWMDVYTEIRNHFETIEKSVMAYD